MEHFGKKLFLALAAGMIAGSFVVIDWSPFAGVAMRWMGFLALVLTLLFRD